MPHALSCLTLLLLAAPRMRAEDADGVVAEKLEVRRRMVVTGDVGFTATAFFLAGDVSLFLGVSAPAIERRHRRRWLAFGVRPTFTFGNVLPTNNIDAYRVGLRLHAALVGATGKRGRFAYAVGVGPVLGFAQRGTAHPIPATPYGVEGEGRFGFLFGAQEGSRAVGQVGGMLRMTVPVGDAINKLFIPTVGVFLGFALRPFESGE